MGGKQRFTRKAEIHRLLDERRSQISDWYLIDQLTVREIHERLVADITDIETGQIGFAIHRFELKRARRTTSPYFVNAIRNRVHDDRVCHHCGETYQPTSARQKFCASCVDTSSDNRRIKNYGVSRRQFREMMTNQSDMCGICRCHLTEDTANVDHDHETGQIRGLLCKRCNLNLHVIEDRAFMKNALRYLGQHEDS